MPYFAPHADVAEMLAELQRCKWLQQGRISRSAEEKLRKWTIPAAAVAGMRAFVADVVARKLPPYDWSGTVINTCKQMQEAAHA
jgi:hypothetical protein